MDRFYRICHRLVAAPIRLVFRIRVTGRENEPAPDAGGYLVCANHMSAWDPVWLGAAFASGSSTIWLRKSFSKFRCLGGL